MIMENKQTQERIRQLIYTSLDRLFEELNELNDSELNGGKGSKEK